MVTNRLVQCKICRRLLPELIFSDEMLDHYWRRHGKNQLESMNDVFETFFIFGKDLKEKVI